MTHVVTCAEFERWLDEGAGHADAVVMRAHAAACPVCGESLAAMEAIDTWFAEPTVAPAGFSDGVMARVAQLDHVPPAVAWVPDPADEMPWWAAILRQPVVVLAAAVAALVMWRGDALLRLATAGASWLASAIPAASVHALDRLTGFARTGAAAAPSSGMGTSELLTVGLAVGLAPVLAYTSFAVSGWVTRRVTRARGPA